MMKRLASLLLILLALSFASEYLIMVDLTENRLTPLFDDGFKVITELENSAMVLIGDTDFNKISQYSYKILDQNPEEGRYYFVRTISAKVDPSVYGEIIWKEGRDYLIRINQGMLEEIMKQQVMLRRLSFNPIVLKDETPPQFRVDPTVQEIVDLVDPDSVLSYVQRLQDYVTRYSTHDSCLAAANWIADKFIEYGCDSVFFQDHTFGHAPNVIGIKHGNVYPDDTYAVVCGHYDAISYLAPDIAPGADDNASGTSGVIEAMRVMKDYDFEYSIRYIAFSGEEFGLYGSEYYAYHAYLQGDDILGVLNADMIGYVDFYPESLDVVAKISNPNCEPFADFFIAAADTYTNLITYKKMVDWAGYSDHAPFWDYGYLALLNIEDDFPVNPYYHSPGDTIGSGYNDNDFCTEVIKAQVAALSLMAEPFETGVTVTIIPDTIFVPRGGELGYTVIGTNNTGSPATFQYWTDIILWNGNPYAGNPLFGPRTVTLQPGQTRQAHLTHAVPPYAPLRTYTCYGRIGWHPNQVWDEDYFEFTVIESDYVGRGSKDWEVIEDNF